MFIEDVPLNVKTVLGTYTFTEDAIMHYARRYDPQPFHIDREAAARSHYGGIIASGWHTAAVWMKLMVAHMQRHLPPQSSDLSFISPGFRELRWFKPVRPGMTLTYSTETVAKLPWPKRPEFGLLESRNEARDENGEVMMSFVGRVLIPRKPK
ncbi:MAG: MaoC family dehydratase [Alphaproteobacteria bacterium]